MCNQKPLIKEG